MLSRWVSCLVGLWPGPAPLFGLVVRFVPANCEMGLVGSVLDHPPPTSSVGGQAPVVGVGGGWLARQVVVMVGCGTGKGG
jgi:hypothetical protein